MNGDGFIGIRVPGKLILMGEYAVRQGSPAVAMAVDRWARVGPGAPERGDLVEQAIRDCARQLGLSDVPACLVDTTAFRCDGRKLGLGSSAAAVVGAAAHVFHRAGWDLSAADTRLQLWRLAKDVHDRFQGASGSGLDLATAIFGGVVVMRGRRPLEDGRFSCRPDLPGLRTVFVWTGEPASTGERLAALDALRMRAPSVHDDLMGRMDALAEAFAAELDAGADHLLPLLDAYGVQMRRLGEAIGLVVETPLMTGLISVARRMGGAAKPSGAGGGDFLVAAFGDSDGAGRFAAAARTMGAWPMDFSPADHGVALAAASSC